MHGTWEPVALMLRKPSKWRHHKGQSTKARHRGGTIHSSNEGSVMRPERRDGVTSAYGDWSTVDNDRRNRRLRAKPYHISKTLVWRAWQRVKANRGAEGIDDQSISEFEEQLKSNLYKIWNRMSSGSYFPPAVRLVEIPKAKGGTRTLGIPTVADRVAQTVAKLYLEPLVEPTFHPDSYGYRPGKSALEAVGVTRTRCWKRDWVIDLDIKGFFDNIDHSLMMRAVRKHTTCPWLLLYIERWLKAPAADETGEIHPRDKGTPQGGVISPLLANLFLHYAFDAWMKREFPSIQFARYADDIIVHCTSERQACYIRDRISRRMQACRLELHPAKTKIVYCKDDHRRKEYPETKFDFLGYTFRSRVARSETGCFVSFLPAISRKALKSIRAEMRSWRVYRRVYDDLQRLGKLYNPKIVGWLNYYGRYYKTALQPLFNWFNRRLSKWVMRKYKKHPRQSGAIKWLRSVARRSPHLFAHWKCGLYP